MKTPIRKPQMGLNFEKVWAALMELREESKDTDRLIRELREESKDTDQRLKDTDQRLKDTDQQLKDTGRLIRELREESKNTDQQLKDTGRLIRELREESKDTDRLLKETGRLVQETVKSVGGLSNSFGELAEHLVAPNIGEKFNDLGYHFKGIAENQKIKNEQGQVIAEIDILLENSSYIVAVEVKSKPRNDDIDNFVRRLEILKKYKDENDDKRKIRGAIAGAVFHDQVKAAVLEAGFYVIEQTGDTVKINVPEGFKPKEW
jgi:dsDNA-specific endonuclease/ATPase MutS2